MAKYKYGTKAATRLKIQHERFEKEKEAWMKHVSNEIAARNAMIRHMEKSIKEFEELQWYIKTRMAIREAFGKKIRIINQNQAK